MEEQLVIRIPEIGPKKMYEELINVLLQYNRLKKDPGKRLRNRSRNYLLEFLISIVFFLFACFEYKSFGPDTTIAACMAALFLCALIFGSNYLRVRKLVKRYMADHRGTVVTLDRSGIELKKEEDHTIRIAWTNIRFIRCFKECICFSSKDDIAGLAIFVSKEYSERILVFLKEHQLDYIV